jgi:hypothetical protein
MLGKIAQIQTDLQVCVYAYALSQAKMIARILNQDDHRQASEEERCE